MLPAKTARTRSVGTKLTEEEYGRLESKAAERGLTVGDSITSALGTSHELRAGLRRQIR